jgi:hypothetical protein
MTAIKAHFDGKVLVPDEPVDLPVNQPLEFRIEWPASKDRPLAKLAQILSAMPDDPGLPSDLAAQHDHYLHGMPKRS